MPREQRRRYAEAFHFAIIDRDLTFRLGDDFADWWCTSGWMVHRTMSDGFVNWSASVFPRVVDDNQEQW
jgi:hypothetical protein